MPYLALPVPFRFLTLTWVFILAGGAIPQGVYGQTKTIFQLQVHSKQGTFRDRQERVHPVIKGGELFTDSLVGPCLRLGDGAENGITLPDPGSISFKGGLTLETKVYFEETPPASGTSFALKPGSFSWDLVRSKMHVSWMSFPNETIFTTTDKQLNYYPVGTELINGLMEVPIRQWVTLTWAYHEELGCITTYINGLTDRKRYRYRGPEPLLYDAKSPFTFLKGFKNCRIASLSLQSGRPQVEPPGLEAFVSPLPYRDKLMVTFDHIDPALHLPVNVTLLTEKASGQAFVTDRFTLRSHQRKDTLLNLPSWKNSWHTLMVHATSGTQKVYQRNFRFANPKLTGKTRIAPDLSIVSGTRNFYPLLLYHAQPEDFGQIAEMGFNTVYNNFNLMGAPPEILLKKSLDSAQQHHLFLLAAANADWGKIKPIQAAKDHPATLGWYAADEPYGDMSRLAESYNTLKLLDPELPILLMMNNYSRLQEAAMGCDILGVDPYPIPKVSLRMVYDATQAAVKAVHGQKPVWTVVPIYDEKIPTASELRCMAWLGVTGGANGIGFFEWDHRIKGKTGGWYLGDSTALASLLRQVVHELSSMQPLLLSPPSGTQPAIIQKNPAIHILLKEKDGKQYLIAVNDSRKSESITLSHSEFKPGQGRPLLPGTASIQASKGIAKIEIPALEVAVWEW